MSQAGIDFKMVVASGSIIVHSIRVSKSILSKVDLLKQD